MVTSLKFTANDYPPCTIMLRNSFVRSCKRTLIATYFIFNRDYAIVNLNNRYINVMEIQIYICEIWNVGREGQTNRLDTFQLTLESVNIIKHYSTIYDLDLSFFTILSFKMLIIKQSQSVLDIFQYWLIQKIHDRKAVSADNIRTSLNISE